MVDRDGRLDSLAGTDSTVMNFVDGNVLGGTFREVFAVDITAAMGRCAGCGQVNAIGTTRVYTHAAGSVARCVHCDDVLIRVVSAADRVFFDFRGLSFLEVPFPEDEPGDLPLEGGAPS